MHENASDLRGRKRRANRCVLAGLLVMAVALVVSDRAPWVEPATTVAAVVGFGLVMYGVHVGWQVFYDKPSDGPPV